MSTSQGAPPSPTASRSKKPMVVTDQPKFDLESYIANYAGRTRIERLLWIGSHSTILGADALNLAITEAKSGKDIHRYIDAQGMLAGIAPHERHATRDQQWMDRTASQNTSETARLEAEVKGYKNNLVKESTRIGHRDLGIHLHAVGDLPKALEAFTRMRQDAHATQHVLETNKHLIEVLIEQRNWIGVSATAAKIKTVMDAKDGDKLFQPLVCIAEGLFHLDNGDYLSAANDLLRADTGMASRFNTIISPNDVAVYGGLCALATLDRNGLNRRVLENSNFRTYLELEPQIRRAIVFFVNSRYSQCLGVLESYRADYLLDIHLSKHVDELFYLIRSKSIVQYFIPFSCVTLDSLNEQFAIPGKTIDKELAQMITAKTLDARIDTQNRLLTSVPVVPRASMQASALSAAKEYEREARRRILHINIHAAELEIRVKGTPKGGASMDDMYDQGRELRSGSRNAGGF